MKKNQVFKVVAGVLVLTGLFSGIYHMINQVAFARNQQKEYTYDVGIIVGINEGAPFEVSEELEVILAQQLYEEFGLKSTGLEFSVSGMGDGYYSGWIFETGTLEEIRSGNSMFLFYFNFHVERREVRLIATDLMREKLGFSTFAEIETDKKAQLRVVVAERIYESFGIETAEMEFDFWLDWDFEDFEGFELIFGGGVVTDQNDVAIFALEITGGEEVIIMPLPPIWESLGLMNPDITFTFGGIDVEVVDMGSIYFQIGMTARGGTLQPYDLSMEAAAERIMELFYQASSSTIDRVRIEIEFRPPGYWRPGEFTAHGIWQGRVFDLENPENETWFDINSITGEVMEYGWHPAHNFDTNQLVHH